MPTLSRRSGLATVRFFTAFHDLIQPATCRHLSKTRTVSEIQHVRSLEGNARGSTPFPRAGARHLSTATSGRRSAATAARPVENARAASEVSQEDAVDVDAYKAFMRSVTSPVAVVTARKTAPSGTHAAFAECIGATISSLTSVCITPTPVLSFNLHEKSGTAMSIAESGTLTVHILAGDRNGESIASAFASPIKRTWHEPFEVVAQLEGHKVHTDNEGRIVMSGPGVLARAHCRLIDGKTVSIGDHLAMFARVRSTDTAPASPVGLSFAQGRYQRSQPLDAAPAIDADRDGSPSSSTPRPSALPSGKRHYSTRSSDSAPPPAETKPFLQQTVREYLSLASMPKHRWRNARALAELDRYGRARVALAIAGGAPDAPAGSLPGGRTNHVDQRIRTLIERLHSANKLGHVSDEVMEGLVLGWKEGEDEGKGR